MTFPALCTSSSLGLIMIIGRSPADASISWMYGNTAYPTMFCGAMEDEVIAAVAADAATDGSSEMNSSASPQSIISRMRATPERERGRPWNTPDPMEPCTHTRTRFPSAASFHGELANELEERADAVHVSVDVELVGTPPWPCTA